ncbi:unnamed protein product [Closterium sp. Yama58-4]|nr:unnamed protein product [Closterium sp. Yama58-4]
MTANPGSTAQEKPQEAAATTLEVAEPEPAPPISAADAPPAVMGIFAPSPSPARCAKPDKSRVFHHSQVISRVEGGALEVRIPAAAGCIVLLTTLLLVSHCPPPFQ